MSPDTSVYVPILAVESYIKKVWVKLNLNATTFSLIFHPPLELNLTSYTIDEHPRHLTAPRENRISVTIQRAVG